MAIGNPFKAAWAAVTGAVHSVTGKGKKTDPVKTVGKPATVAPTAGYKNAGYFVNWLVLVRASTTQSLANTSQGHLWTQLPACTDPSSAANSRPLRLCQPQARWNCVLPPSLPPPPLTSRPS